MKIGIMSLVAASFLAGPLAAAGVMYDCKVTQRMGPDGWISPRMALVIDDNGGKVIDALTQHFETGPRPAKLRKQGDTLRIKWSFSALTDDSSQNIPRVNYSAVLNTKTGAIKVRGKPPRFPQTVKGVGTCATRNNLTPRQLNQLLKG